jgi:2-polyprenyl-3-methyl-5-hydroxy-6-metoxy-1,4-benzoquinol methylase
MRFNPEAFSIRVNRQGKPLRVPERLLLSVCRPVNAPALPVATYGYTLENCLDFGKRMIPDFPACLRGKTVLDFGCGHGFQAIAMAQAGAGHVHGVDIIPEFLEAGRSLAAKTRTGNVSFGADAEPGGYDVVISLGAMEHFGDPAAILRQMLSLARER